jgi:hypothetical protein
MQRRKFGIAGYLAVIALAYAGLVAATLALPTSPYIRYQSLKGTMFESTRYFYERLHDDRTPIDVLVVGASRAQMGISPPLLEQALANKGRALHVLNMSIASSGFDLYTAEVNEALRAHPEIRLVVVNVVETFPREGHQAFKDIASTGDVLHDPLIANSKYFENVLSLPMRQLRLAVATWQPAAFGYQGAFVPENYAGAVADQSQLPGWHAKSPDHPLDSAAHRQDLETESARRRREITPPVLPARFAGIEFGIARTSVARIAATAHAHGAKVAFLFLPFYRGWDQPAETPWLARFGPVWSADMTISDPAMYLDAAHPSPRALPVLNAWLADRIAQTLPESPAQHLTGRKPPA